jgi:iron complex transport system substrate-binding protein
MSPQSLEEIFGNVRELGAAANQFDAAQTLIAECHARLRNLADRTSQLAKPRVFCMEWFEPIYASGHWVPEMVKLAGGCDELARAGGESVRISWDELSVWAPEVLIFMPCGCNLQQTMKELWKCLGQYSSLSALHSSLFQKLPAVIQNRVYAVDANSYFARPGPRVVEGTELLAHLIHPEVFGWTGPATAYQQVDLKLLSGSLAEGHDYYVEGNTMVFTSSYLQRRGYCCSSGCRHCPYGFNLR